MLGMKGNERKILKFSTNPFYLYPVKEDMIDRLFVDREEEINIAKGLMGMRFSDTAEICAVVGGIGVGKSSILHYITNIAKKSGYSAEFYDNPDDFYSGAKNPKKKDIVNIVDNIDKLDEENACKYYNFIEKHVGKIGGIIFFSDNYSRDKKTLKLRNFTVSQNISLPRGLSREKLRYFLEERMKKCLKKGNKLVFPFDDNAMEMASVRSAGNLRNFLSYAKNGWMVTIGGGGKKVTKKEMKAGMVIVDRALLGSCDLIDIKILWNSTSGDINKSYLAHQCGIDSKTLDSHIENSLADLITQKRSGKDVLITSIYRYIDDGPEILEKIIEGLGIRKLDVTGEK
jgi:hypothetical protein